MSDPERLPVEARALDVAAPSRGVCPQCASSAVSLSDAAGVRSCEGCGARWREGSAGALSAIARGAEAPRRIRQMFLMGRLVVLLLLVIAAIALASRRRPRPPSVERFEVVPVPGAPSRPTSP